MGAEEVSRELNDVPDLVGPPPPLAVSDPRELLRQIIRGFCEPNNEQWDTATSSPTETPEASTPRGEGFETPTVITDDTAYDNEIDPSLEEYESAEEESLDEEEDDVIVVETKPETARIIRVLRGLEILLVAVVILVVNFRALARIGVDFGFQMQPKLAGDETSFMSIAYSSAKNKLFRNPEQEALHQQEEQEATQEEISAFSPV